MINGLPHSFYAKTHFEIFENADVGKGVVYKLLMVADVGGGGVKIWQKSADVINGRPLSPSGECLMIPSGDPLRRPPQETLKNTPSGEILVTPSEESLMTPSGDPIRRAFTSPLRRNFGNPLRRVFNDPLRKPPQESLC